MASRRPPTIPWVRSKHRLALLWFIGSALILTLVFLLTILGGDSFLMRETWSWLLPMLMPTLLLIVGALVAEPGGGRQKKNADRFTYRASFGLSLAYLVTIAMVLLLAPFSQGGLLEQMKLSNLWLGPFQGLVAASLGAFFIRTGDTKTGGHSSPS